MNEILNILTHKDKHILIDLMPLNLVKEKLSEKFTKVEEIEFDSNGWQVDYWWYLKVLHQDNWYKLCVSGDLWYNEKITITNEGKL